MHTAIHTKVEKYAKRVFIWFFLLLLFRIYSHALLIYTFDQPVKGPGTDYTFWLSHLLCFPEFIIHNRWACCIIDAGVIMLSLAAVLSDKNRNGITILLILFFFVQRITLESYSVSHTKSISCLFAALLPFCFKKSETTELLIEFGRFFLIYILVISAYHKFQHGALLGTDTFSAILVNQHTDLAVLHPGHISYKVAKLLIQYPFAANLAFKLLFITQSFFIIGIFTKRADRILFVLLMGFAISTYLVMRIYNFDITLLGLSLLYFPISKKRG
ncbi:MAG: hypothetical protein IPM95_02590 [Sphingobacteriales bacterium]|nr:hypothetical protein [Sphingobacteriales bacterium]